MQNRAGQSRAVQSRAGQSMAKHVKEEQDGGGMVGQSRAVEGKAK